MWDYLLHKTLNYFLGGNLATVFDHWLHVVNLSWIGRCVSLYWLCTCWIASHQLSIKWFHWIGGARRLASNPNMNNEEHTVVLLPLCFDPSSIWWIYFLPHNCDCHYGSEFRDGHENTQNLSPDRVLGPIYITQKMLNTNKQPVCYHCKRFACNWGMVHTYS